jgi:hypothetical protein
MAIFVPIDGLGIDGIDVIAVAEPIVDSSPTCGFPRHQHRGRVRLMLGNLRVERREALRTMGDLELGERGRRVLGEAHLMMLISPIDASIQHPYNLSS